MGYIRAEEVLPTELIEVIQQYVDGANIYVPRKEENRASWGQISGSKISTYERDRLIYQEYRSGCKVQALAEKYCLSDKSIWRILRNRKSEY